VIPGGGRGGSLLRFRAREPVHVLARHRTPYQGPPSVGNIDEVGHVSRAAVWQMIGVLVEPERSLSLECTRDDGKRSEACVPGVLRFAKIDETSETTNRGDESRSPFHIRSVTRRSPASIRGIRQPIGHDAAIRKIVHGLGVVRSDRIVPPVSRRRDCVDGRRTRFLG
jgi:hypothetical protein